MAHPVDTQNMEKIISQSPGQFRAGLEAAKDVKVPGGPFGGVLLAGMGGSWMAGALVRDAKLCRVPIHIHRDYGLPNPIPLDNPLVVASTFSGNTQETLSAYDAARDKGLPIVAITRRRFTDPDTGKTVDGELAKRSERDAGAHDVSLVRIPADPPTMQPRSATGYTVGILVRLLDRLGLAAEGAVAAMEALEGPLQGFVDPAREHAQRLLPGLAQATPVIYTSDTYATVAQIFKIKINEHAKTAAFWNVFPELNHNEMTGWVERRGPFHLVFLRDADDSPCVLRRMDLAREILSEYGLSSAVVPIEGASLVEKIFGTMLVGEWAAYQLALARGVDPTPVDIVEGFKRRLKAIDPSC
jgi:glucose/mannose-6-phosphate isomerase